jgi:hypothetical protein
MIQPADILGLPQGQAFALLEGNRRFKLRIPMPKKEDDPFVPESIRQVASDMKARYRTSEQWARETDWLGNQPIGMAGVGVIDTGLALAEAVPDETEIETTAAVGRNGPALRSGSPTDLNSSTQATGVFE